MAIINNPIVSYDGLIMCLDAGNKASYPGFGSTWSSLLGSYSGTFVNDATYVTDNGGALLFDGTDDFIELNSNNIISGTNPFSIDCWYTLSSGNFGQLLGNYGDGYASDTLWFSTAGLYINNYVTIPSYSTVTQGTHHIAATRDSSGNCIIYLDGVQKATGSLTASIISSPNFRIGANTKASTPTGTGLSDELDGKIYQLKVYNRVLTQTEVVRNYRSIRNRFLT